MNKYSFSVEILVYCNAWADLIFRILPVLTSNRIEMTHDMPGHRVLLVEDEAMIAMLVEDMSEDLGHELVTVATRLEEALTAARNEAVDLAILDLNLGGVLTYPAADVLAERGIPFIFATGDGSGGLKEAYSTRPALQKPFNGGAWTFDQQALGHET
jgi:CheY-like chemotaxis protein